MKPTIDILLVDDDAPIRDALTETLEDEGYQVATAIDGADALRYLQEHPAPQLILLDLMMPVMDGWAFLEVAQQDGALRTIPVVVLSAHALTEDETRRLKISLYLRKPIKLESLITIVEGYCRPDELEYARAA